MMQHANLKTCMNQPNFLKMTIFIKISRERVFYYRYKISLK